MENQNTASMDEFYKTNSKIKKQHQQKMNIHCG